MILFTGYLYDPLKLNNAHLEVVTDFIYPVSCVSNNDGVQLVVSNPIPKAQVAYASLYLFWCLDNVSHCERLRI